MFFLVLQRGFESCTKATNVAFIAQFKNWAIPLFAFPSPARGSKCKRIPAGAPPKKLPGAKRGGAEKKPGSSPHGCCFPVPRKGKQMQANPRWPEKRRAPMGLSRCRQSQEKKRSHRVFRLGRRKIKFNPCFPGACTSENTLCSLQVCERLPQASARSRLKPLLSAKPLGFVDSLRAPMGL